ncbi:peptide/nickel transport system permease protein/oligopeptide transport system permease protein [Mobilisporobacter senegalensis]|uniref:Peptide/nickel transport system permease protein/oligopeptide transport system permease protein n=1 Tax=Mobilisporobacter senegalensis TaxID=1329262 RepID=A0A3N1XQK7_9FIRM|nr:ABC transporter permease [Mobilisporobacter senegalensis]ROR28558.1 peptide/nickel transport system permease protein/oligopeptide transport system permease protein [Mobilisporobacter senegalensis]
MKYIFKKIITLIITLLVISLLTFLAFQIIPGDSALTALGTNATKEAIDALREELGLNEPLFIRYGSWLSGIIKGDFGLSSQYNIPVSSLLKDRFIVTFYLAVIALIVIIVLSFPFGILTVKKEGGFLDRVITLICQINMAIPPFFLGMLITLIFGLILKMFTPGAYVGIQDNFLGFLGYLFFPAVAIALPKAAMLIKFLRSSLLRQLKLDYVRTARSKGDTEHQILYKHVLKNGLIPVITFLAMMIADVFAGSIMIEQVFSLPGLGRLLVVAISNRDFPVVSAIIMYIAILIVFINFIVDILYQYIDPRVRIS